ncbi:MlaD family protein [Dissulfurimicrobium hydrothermale]|uniref:MlaD family protein n=1 Tax=Dissulfurimicrobium hydrothermale TaxID=1750598 RepID=UPI001EDBC77F|nr:MlaD family protein [Dissulfurimicrobium hydrothermale]UKL14535.1 MCE family protein [Dissulfurimicrobium hydrothermale]
METRANYTIVGLFVMIFTIGALVFAMWLGGFYKKDRFKYYYTELKESVSGLNKDAPVKYMGVTIGSVKDIMIDPSNPTKVRILLEVQKDTPILQGMYATLNFTGITGIAYIEIRGGKQGALPLTAKNGGIPVIPSRPSLFSEVGMSAANITGKLEQAIDRINRLMTDENADHLNAFLQHLDELSGRLNDGFSPKTIDNIRLLVENLTEASQRLKNIATEADSLRPMARELSQKADLTLDRLASASSNIDELSLELDKKVKAGDYDIKPMLEPSVFMLNDTLREARSLLSTLHEEAKAIGNSPADLLLKRSRPLLGPGEESEK